MRQLGEWNTEKGLWEKPEDGLFSGLSEPFSETWPTSGTTRSGKASAPTKRELRIAASACSSSPVLPTPVVADSEGSRRLREDGTPYSADGYPNLSDVAALLPTPEAKLADHGPDLARANRAGSGGNDLATAVALLPTPSAAVVNDGEDPTGWLARREKVRARGINGNGMGMPLTIAAQILASGDHSPLPSSGGST